jgi:hypothetical protein
LIETCAKFGTRKGQHTCVEQLVGGVVRWAWGEEVVLA